MLTALLSRPFRVRNLESQRPLRTHVNATLLIDWPPHPNLSSCRDNETAWPSADTLSLKQLLNALNQALSLRRTQADEQDSVVCPWRIATRIRKIQVLCYQKTFFALCRFPNLLIGTPGEPFLRCRMNIMPECFQLERDLQREVFVELDSHRIWGTGGTGRSSSADAAANAIAA